MPINVGQAIGYLDLDTSSFSKGLKSAWKDLKTFTDDTKSLTDRTSALGKGLNSMGTTLTKNLTVPIAAAGAASLKAGIEFESAFAGIRKTVDATETEFEQLREGILDMAREMPKSASELAAVGEIAGQLGIQTESILDFTKAMVMLGDTTNLSSEEAATALARFANITGMSQDNFERLGSSIVQLGNNFATTEAEIASLALNLSSTGSIVGLSESEIVGLAAAISSVGIEAELGGTAVSKLFSKMQLAVEEGGVALQNFATVANMSSEEFSDLFKEDAIGALQSWLVGLKDFDRLGSSTIKILTDVGIKEVRLRDTTQRLANAGDLLNNAITMSNNAWEENAALVDEANKRYETTESQLKILWNNVVELGIRLADVLLPTFKKIVEALQEFVQWLDNMDEGVLTAIVTISGIVAVVGPVLSIIGKLITTITKIITVVKNCTVVITALKAVLTALTGPVGIAIVAIAGLTAGIIALSKGTYTQTEKQKELNKYMNESKIAYDEAIESAEKQEESLLSNTIAAKDLIEEMYNLSEQEMDTATKVEILKSMNNELKELIPDLNIEIDEETGKIKTQKDEVNKLIAAQIKLQATKIYGEKNAAEAKRYTEALIARNKAIENATETDKKYEAQKKKVANMQEKMDDFEWWETHESTNYAIAIRQQQEELKKLDNEYHSYTNAIEENEKIMEDSKTKMESLQKEQEKVEEQIMKNLGIQLDANGQIIDSNKEVEESDDKKTDNEEENTTQTKILTQEELDAIKKAEEEKQKEKEKAFEAEKDRYNKLKDTTQKYFDDINDIYAKSNEEILKIEDERKQQVEEVTKEYENILQERNEELRNSYGLFDEFVKADDDSLSGNQLLKNLKSQLSGVKEWRQNLDELAERGVTQGLLDELKELGPKSAVEIENLTKLSDKKLQEYVQTWQELNDETFRQAVIDVEPEKRAMESKIDEINADAQYKTDLAIADAENAIDTLTKDYITSIEDLGVKVVPEAKDAGIEIIKAIEIGVDETEESLFTKLQNLKDEVSSIVRSIKSEVASAENAADSIDGSHKSGLDYVPYDGYIAQLHKGERVLTEQENRKYNEGNIKTSGSQTLNVNFGGSLGQLIRLLKPEFELDDNRGGVQY